MNRIQKFTITKLFGYQNVNLVFRDNVMILMGENGLGKTSILNSLYFTLTQKWRKLSDINFESIELCIDNRIFKFTKKQLLSYIENLEDENIDRHKYLKHEVLKFIDVPSLIEYINDRYYDDKIYDFKQYRKINKQHNKIKRDKLIYDFVIKSESLDLINAPIDKIITIIDKILKQPDLAQIEFLDDYLSENGKLNILYFPTYRRVEEELHNLGKITRVNRDGFSKMYGNRGEIIEHESLEDETLIQFGMEDVEQRIKKIISKINDSSIKGFTKVTGEMLHQLQKGFPALTKQQILGINKNNLEIILNRVKNNLSDRDRENILRLLDTKELLDKKELAYFLIKLEDIYLEQRELDNAIKDFKEVCNGYLVGKKFLFDESSVSLKIYNDITEEQVELNQLSSGEKQIVSIFSKLYLEESRNQLIFFDEPELSLSIKWQKRLLPDVLRSGKCSFLLAVTHSPFIFNNILENYAVGMNVFID